MTYYIGIDLGTTNSAISTFDGENVRVWKTKEQSDVTPSCIFIDKKGKKFYGAKAYKGGQRYEDRVARQFKRFMGTSTKIEYADVSMTPEECSAEILRALTQCLDEKIINSDDKATIITVPAAFDQMQNEATKQAAKLANIGKVAVMQEPVAAIMSVMKNRKNPNGTFLIFDMGGGTLDVAIANCVNSKVDVIAHGGVAMCGGADIDTLIVDNCVIPWLINESDYELPERLRGNKKYEKMLARARYKAEEAKIELSSDSESTIYGSLGSDITDENGEEIELDIPITREILDSLIGDLLQEAIECARDTIKKSGIPASDFDRIVFIGGPTNYKPLRDKVARELGIRSEGLEVNPMTAVSEGAAIYAETIDWNSVEHERKDSHGMISSATDLGLKFKFEARTTKNKARFAIMLKSDVSDYTLQIKSVDSGWDSGIVDLENGQMVALPLSKMGDNTFEIYVFDSRGRKINLEENTVVITRTMASVGSILASHTLSVEVRESSLNDTISGDPLVNQGEKLPVKAVKRFKAAEKIKAGSEDSLVFKVWEGELTNVSDNKFVGCMKITGEDLEDYGNVRVGDDIEFEYTINEAGHLEVNLSIERLGLSITSGKNFFSTEDAKVNMSDEDTIRNIEADGERILDRVDDFKDIADDDRLEQVKKIGTEASELGELAVVDPEKVKKNSDNILKAKMLLDQIRNDYLVAMREKELKDKRDYYKEMVEEHASDVEKEEIENMFNNCEKLMPRKDKAFEATLSEINSKCIHILFNNCFEYVVALFKHFRSCSYEFTDKTQFNQLVDEGMSAIVNDEPAKLRRVVVNMIGIMRRDSTSIGDIGAMANIMKG